MIRINLLPFRAARKKENVRQQISIFLLLILFIAIILVWYNSKLNERILALNDQIQYTNSEIIRYKKIAKEVEELKKKRAVLKTKLQVIKDLNLNRTAAFQLLDSMTHMVVAKKMWFTKLEALDEKVRKARKKRRSKKNRSKKKKNKESRESGKKIAQPKKVNIKIEGIALDNKTVAAFMTRLEESDIYTDVKLITLKQKLFKQGRKKEDIRLKSFVVSCKKLPPKQPEVQAKIKKGSEEKS